MKPGLNDRRAVSAVLFGLILFTGAGLRFHQLGAPSMTGDVLEFLTYCQRTTDAADVFAKWNQLQEFGHLPFAPAATKWVITTFGLSLSHTSVRLASAIWGTATIAAAFLLGLILQDKRLGLVLSALLALTPIHIDLSRQSYFYAPTVLGGYLMVAAILYFYVHFNEMDAWDWKFHVLHVSGFFLLCFSSPSGWSLAAIGLATVLAGAVWKAWREKRPWLLLSVLSCYTIILVPILSEPWGWTMIAKAAHPYVRAYSQEVFIGVQDGFLRSCGTAVALFAWGDTPIRALFSGTALALGILWVARSCREQRYLLLIPGLFAADVIVVWFGRMASGHPFAPRYLLAALPAFQLLLGLGLLHSGDILARVRSRAGGWRAAVSCALIAAAIGLYIRPACLSHRWIGEFKAAVQWADAQFAPGTPVLCDRYFTAWKEWVANNPTNAVFMSTVPNQVVEEYERNKWRETAQIYLTMNADAAFCEQRMHWERLGPWTWPHDHFARSNEFVDEIDLELKRIGLRHRGAPSRDSTEPQIGITIYYNTRDDLLEKARREGTPAVVMFGSGWGYRKRRDYTDWRALLDRAAIDVYNLTPLPLSATVRIRGIAMDEPKTVTVSDAVTKRFDTPGAFEWHIRDDLLPPGRSEWVLSDPEWDGDGAPLLVSVLEITLNNESDRP